MSETHAKVATIRISVNANDPRSIDEFIQDAKQALESTATLVTALGGYYLIDGQPIRGDGTHAITGKETEEKKEKKAKKKTARKKVTKVNEAPTEEPWCNHDAPHLLPGDTCECGETVPEPTCEACDKPWGEDPSCSTCNKSQAEAVENKEDVVRKLAQKTLSMRRP